MPADVWLQPLATVVGALLVGAVAYVTLRQKRAADDAVLRHERAVLAHDREIDQRSQWWLRAQWAIDKSLAPDPLVRDLGVGALQVLADEPASPADLAVLLLAVRRAVDPADLAPQAHTGPDPEGAPRGADEQP